jgi:hypothetical protein
VFKVAIRSTNLLIGISDVPGRHKEVVKTEQSFGPQANLMDKALFRANDSP